jgi:exonuclease VII small subunit
MNHSKFSRCVYVCEVAEAEEVVKHFENLDAALEKVPSNFGMAMVRELSRFDMAWAKTPLNAVDN